NGGSCYGEGHGGDGDENWAHATDFGTSRFLYVEDNVFNSGAANDCAWGGRNVFRHNAFNMTAPAPALQTHPTGPEGRARGCRAWEVYQNTFTGLNYISDALWMSAGSGLVWGNTIPVNGTAGYGTW